MLRHKHTHTATHTKTHLSSVLFCFSGWLTWAHTLRRQTHTHVHTRIKVSIWTHEMFSHMHVVPVSNHKILIKNRNAGKLIVCLGFLTQSPQNLLQCQLELFIDFQSVVWWNSRIQNWHILRHDINWNKMSHTRSPHFMILLNPEILVKSFTSKLLLYQPQHPPVLFLRMYEVLILGWREAERAEACWWIWVLDF